MQHILSMYVSPLHKDTCACMFLSILQWIGHVPTTSPYGSYVFISQAWVLTAPFNNTCI